MRTNAAMLMAFLLLGTVSLAQKTGLRQLCDDNQPLCTETLEPLNYENQYTGHDEPSVLFYSNTPGSGNSNRYFLRLPKDPPRQPKQDGTGGTFNFQLHPAFWFGMAMCDSQSAPEFTTTCVADTDANIFDGGDPAAADYIGKHPGTAFMEMQFYPPGWVLWPPGNSCDATRYCAALNIDSFSQNQNTGVNNNNDCLNKVGIEPVNFAFITRNGVAQAPANPLDATLATFTPNPSKVLLMNPGDRLIVDLHDTSSGFAVVIQDLDTGQSGSMTASIANGFAQINFAPTATTCTNTPYAFHPMYSTSSEHTRVPWAAHSYNVAFSDEIGHFEYCNKVSAEGGTCTQAGVGDTGGVDADDTFCFDAAASSRIPIGGCFGTDIDFDGVPYQLTWPGTLSLGKDQQFNPRAILFTSPLFNGTQNYDRVAFEADLPRIEFSTNPPCNRSTGANCVNPPVGANFYPFYTTRNLSTPQGQTTCVWQLGGAGIPGTKDTFGGSSTSEFGSLLLLTYPGPGFTPIHRFNNFRQVLSDNACPATGIN